MPHHHSVHNAGIRGSEVGITLLLGAYFITPPSIFPITQPSEVQVLKPLASHLRGRLHYCTGGYEASFHIPPQCNNQFTGKRDDSDLARRSRLFLGVLLIPARECAFWLVSQPTPCKLNAQRSRLPVACFTDALIMLNITTGIRTRCKSNIRSEVLAILE